MGPVGAQPLGIGPLIAREAELARLTSLLATEPLITLRGTAGVGKSRLAMEAVRASTGSVVVALADLRARCVMTTYDPDTLEQDPHVLRSIVERFDGTLALNASVERGGELRVGDPVTLL